MPPKQLLRSALAALAILPLMATANSYYMIIAVDGAQPGSSEPSYTPQEREDAWVGFAGDPRNLPYVADWSSTNWSSRSLTELPVEPYPNTTPTAVQFFTNSISDITGLSGITSVSGRFDLYGNDISSLSPLSDLENVGSFFTLNGNSFTSLSGLENFRTGSYLSIHSNPSLSDISAIQNVSSLGTLAIDNREYTTRMPVSSPLCQAIVNGTTDLTDSSGSTNLPEGLACQSTSEWQQFAMNDLALDYTSDWSSTNWSSQSLTALPTETYPNSTPTTVQFYTNTISDISGLSGITNVSGRFDLYGNLITNLSALSDLVSVGSFFTLHDNALTSLNGLENFRTGSYLSIYANPSLSNVSAIQNVTSLGTLAIDNRQYATRMPSASPLCQSIINGTTDLTTSGGAALPTSHVCN